jgi:hypothetical protein
MGAIEVNSKVATEGDNSAECHSLLIEGELSRGLRRGSAVPILLGLRVRVSPRHECLL